MQILTPFRSFGVSFSVTAMSLLILISVSSCSGGGGGGSVAPPASGAVGGAWNLFISAEAGPCNAEFELDFLEVELTHRAGNQVQVLIGEAGEQFEFAGVYDSAARTLKVSGTDIVDGTQITISSATWQADANRNVFSGSMLVQTLEPGESSCQDISTIRMYRQDSTQNSPLYITGGDANAFDLTMRVLESDNPTRVGHVEELLAAFYPQRAGNLTFEVYSPASDVSVYFKNVHLEGQNLRFPPNNIEGDIFIVGTQLIFDAQTNSISGTLQTFDAEDGNETLEFIATPMIAIQIVNNIFTSHDFTTYGAVKTADRDSLQVAVVDPGLATFQTEITERAMLATRGSVDPLRGRIQGVKQSSLYYTMEVAPGFGELRRARQNGASSGGAQGYDVMASGPEFNSMVSNLIVETDLHPDGRDYISFSSGPGFGQSYALVTGSSSQGTVGMIGRIIASRHDHESGAFKGWITRSDFSGLHMYDALGNPLSDLHSSTDLRNGYLGTTEAGDLFFLVFEAGSMSGGIWVLRAGENALTPLAGGVYPPQFGMVIPADVDGDTLYFMNSNEDQSQFGMFSINTSGESAFLSTAAQFAPFDFRSEVAVAGERIVFTFVSNDIDHPHVLMSMALDGSDAQVLDEAIATFHLDIFAVSDQRVFYNESSGIGGIENGARSVSLSGADAPEGASGLSEWVAIKARPIIEFSSGPLWRPECCGSMGGAMTSIESGAAITTLVPGHVPEIVFMLEREIAGLNERLIAIDAQSGEQLSVVYDRLLDGGGFSTLGRVASGFQTPLLAEVSDASGIDVYQFDLDSSGESYFVNISNSPGIEEQVLTR